MALSTRLWGRNPTNSIVIPQSVMLRSIVIGWILMQRNWSILLTSFPRKCLGNRRSSCELLCIGESSPRQLQTFVAPIGSLELSWNFKLRWTSQIFAVKVVTRQNLLWKIRKYNSRRSLDIKCSLHLVTTPRLTWDSVYWDQNIFFSREQEVYRDPV